MNLNHSLVEKAKFNYDLFKRTQNKARVRVSVSTALRRLYLKIMYVSKDPKLLSKKFKEADLPYLQSRLGVLSKNYTPIVYSNVLENKWYIINTTDSMEVSFKFESK